MAQQPFQRKGGNLSDFWREDRSDDRVRELTSVLRGSDSLIGVMGSGVRAVWSTNGESETWWVRTRQGKDPETRVFLDYSPLRDLPPPFTGQAVDEVIGYAAHEGGHCLWSSPAGRDEAVGAIRRSTNPATQRAANSPAKVEEVLRVANILEDAYIDYHVGDEWPVLGEYIQISRREIRAKRPIDLDQIAHEPRPTYNQMLNLWIACSLYDQPLPDRMSARVRRAMTFLMGKSIEAVQSTAPIVRMTLSVECWERLTRDFPKRDDPLPSQLPPSPPQPPQEQPEQDAGQADRQKPEQGEPQQEAGDEETEGDKGDEESAGGQGKAGTEGGGGEDEDTEGDNVPTDGAAEASVEEADTEGDSAQEGDGEEADGDEGEGGAGEEDEGEADADTDDEAADGDRDQDHAHIGGDEEGKPEDGEEPADQSQGGDEPGAPGNLDDFDIRDIAEVPPELLEEVLSAIAHEMEDLTRSVAEVLNRPIGDVNAQTRKADYDAPTAARVEQEVQKEIQEMARVFDRQAALATRHMKGLTVGKLDTRSLARVGTGSRRVFKRREILETPDLAVGLLLDVSGSMHGQMSYVWATACVFAEGLIRKKGVNFLALTYTGGYFSVETTRICDREMGRLCLGNVRQGGGTPTGPAIASMKTLMDRMPERRKVIIHFTDGSPDDRYSVIAAVEECRKAGYQVWAISLHQYAGMLQQQYGDGSWETIGAIAELPARVANLVKGLVATR